jgi:hypothetical protein
MIEAGIVAVDSDIGCPTGGRVVTYLVINSSTNQFCLVNRANAITCHPFLTSNLSFKPLVGGWVERDTWSSVKMVDPN